MEVLRIMKISDLFAYPNFYTLLVNNLVIGLIITGSLIILFLYLLYLIISNAVERGVTRALEKHSKSIDKK